ncbi:hypothetical protein OH807_30580 [Kitasatospora sp. NBC_01560]|uniref:hypothetical protein n=1 Tax=Kitasatospora sp. NBC_01560 TaxID=2975965 RepID=UPI0038649446
MDQYVEILHWNTQHGRKLDAAIAWLRKRAKAAGRMPAALMLNELQPGQGEHVGGELGLLHYPAPVDDGLDPADSRRRNLNAIFIDPDGPLVPDPEWVANWTGPWMPPATLPVNLRNPDGTLSSRQLYLACEHACYWHPGYRETTARFYTVLGKDGRLVHVDGDFNAWTVGRAPLTLANVADRAFAQNRSVLCGTALVADDIADRLMTAGGFVYVHGHAAEYLGIEGADAPTTDHGPDKERQLIPEEDQPERGLSAIDRTYTTAELIPAVIDANVITDPDVDALADHKPRYTRYGYPDLVAITNLPVELVHH